MPGPKCHSEKSTMIHWARSVVKKLGGACPRKRKMELIGPYR